MRQSLGLGLSALVLSFAMLTQAEAGLITNGGFEAGLSGWTTVDQSGSDGSFTIQSGTTSPVNGFTVPAPPEGVNAAMTDAGAPGSHILYQDFTVGNTPYLSATLSFQLYINNQSSSGFKFPAINSLDFTTLTENQQARVDILKGSAGAFSVAGADVLLNVYVTKATDPLVSGYTLVTADLTALFNANQGQTLRLRFAEVDNAAPFNFGVDDVALNATPTPEPSTILSAVVAITGTVIARRRRMFA